MISTTKVPFKTPSANGPRRFTAPQDITSMVPSTATPSDASTAVTKTIRQGSPVAFNASLSLREQTLRSAEALQTVTDVANMALKHLKKKGFVLDESAALQIALKHQQMQEEIHYQRQQEARRYLWEAHKSEQTERRREENLEAAREDKNWLLKLKNARDEAVKTTIMAVQHGMWLAVAGRGLVFVYTTYKKMNEPSISGLFTETVLYIKAMFVDQCMTDSSDVIDSPSWWGHASTYVTSYVPSLENISCMALRIYGLVAVLLGTGALSLLSSVIKKCLSSTVGCVFETAFVAAFLMMLSWTFIPWVPIAATGGGDVFANVH